MIIFHHGVVQSMEDIFMYNLASLPDKEQTLYIGKFRGMIRMNFAFDLLIDGQVIKSFCA